MNSVFKNKGPTYDVRAVVNNFYVALTFSCVEGKWKIRQMVHDPNEHDTSKCVECSTKGEWVRLSSLLIRENLLPSLFQQLIHHPSIRLHCAYINPSDLGES